MRSAKTLVTILRDSIYSLSRGDSPATAARRDDGAAAGAARTTCPHSLQNLAAVGSSVPHSVQRTAKRLPQSRQNFEFGGLSWPQLVHSIVTSVTPPRW